MELSFFISHHFTCVFMCGLIWVIQLVHYPSFPWIPEPSFAAFEGFHRKRIGLIVIPVMVVELITGIYLAGSFSHWPFALNILLLVLCWFITGFVSVPAHNRLSQGRDDAMIRRLVQTNWARTALWTIRAVLLTWVLYGTQRV